MTEQMLRQKVVDYMKKMAKLEWTPEKTFISYNPGNIGTKMFSIFRAGTTYYGLPYINFNMAQAETFEKWRHDSYIPYTGTEEQLDSIHKTADLIAIGGEILESSIKNAFTFPGSDCVSSVFMAWNTVINNRPEIQELQTVSTTIPGKGTGIVAVGEYNYTDTFDDNTDEMTKNNGEEVMAKAYSLLKPADAVTYIRKNNGNARHIRLVIEYPHIEYVKNEDGTEAFDMDKSYITILDQAGGAAVRFIKEDNYSSFHVKQYTFKELYTEGSLPVSIPELTEGAYVEENTYIEGLEYYRGKLCGKIKTNRQLFYVKAIISDGVNTFTVEDDVAMTDRKAFTNYHIAEYDLEKLDQGYNLFMQRGKEHSVSIYVCTSGNDGVETELVKDFKFTR